MSEFEYVKEHLIDILNKKFLIKDKPISTIEEYINVVDTIDTTTYTEEKIEERIATLYITYSKLVKNKSIEDMNILIRVTELFCIHSLYPKEVANTIIDIKSK